jgi:hypothetical protein
MTYKTTIKKSDYKPIQRILVATPTLGTVRMEWVQSRYGQIIPTNWGMVQYNQFVNSFIPLQYTIPDAQNIIVKETIEKQFEWLLLIEDDTMPPPDGFIKINQHMKDGTVPVVSGLYYTKSNPSEPLIYRGRGTSYYDDWKLGDQVWADGVPTGFLLINCKVLWEMWKESAEYMAGDVKTRRIFETPEKMWYDPDKGAFNTTTGTSDLEWCTRVIEGNYLTKAGFDKVAKKKYPFLVDTTILCRHITPSGEIFPK